MGTGHEKLLIIKEILPKIVNFLALNEAFLPQNGTPKK
jgi:hypothetical protein